MFTLTEETADDWWEVEALYDLCFAPGREALSSYRLRDGVAPVGDLCLVARDELGIIAGAIRYHLSNSHPPADPIYGDGHAGERIAELLATVPLTIEKRMAY